MHARVTREAKQITVSLNRDEAQTLSKACGESDDDRLYAFYHLLCICLEDTDDEAVQ